MDFATKLKCYRKMMNITQNEIADAMGVSRSTYAYYETGKTLPTSEGIRFLSQLFGVSPAVLLNEKPVAPPKPPATKAIFCDSGPEILFGKQEKQTLDMTFPELSEDEKEMILKYRVMKFAESNLPDTTPNKKGEIIRRFLAKHYK